MSNWTCVCDVSDSLEVKRSAVERLHREHIRGAVEEMLDEIGANHDNIEALLDRAMANPDLQRLIDETFTEMVGRESLN
jgi:hypothetical protein